MAYGQTGTGKTYTLGRLGEEDLATRGITVRAMEDILAGVSLDTDSVTVSYLQVFGLLFISLYFLILSLSILSYYHFKGFIDLGISADILLIFSPVNNT